MSEYIVVRGEVVGCDKGGKPFYNMHLTNEEVIRCRDCEFDYQSECHCSKTK